MEKILREQWNKSESVSLAFHMQEQSNKPQQCFKNQTDHWNGQVQGRWVTDWTSGSIIEPYELVYI